ncbi:hypothetical protein GQ53DRAFT_141759 [Thozetella sp. PMI_491]|nr:hypothetical protein GQ53DRAFT_141759 [Thozetella sp. PMI_491]
MMRESSRSGGPGPAVETADPTTTRTHVQARRLRPARRCTKVQPAPRRSMASLACLCACVLVAASCWETGGVADGLLRHASSNPLHCSPGKAIGRRSISFFASSPLSLVPSRASLHAKGC